MKLYRAEIFIVDYNDIEIDKLISIIESNRDLKIKLKNLTNDIMSKDVFQDFELRRREAVYNAGYHDGRHGTPCEQIRAQNENEQLTDTLDLMRDEFKRIKSCPGADQEIIVLCDRAITRITQNVPVITQRDNAEAELAKIKSVLKQFGELL